MLSKHRMEQHLLIVMTSVRRCDKGSDPITQVTPPSKELDLCHLLFTKQSLKYRHLDTTMQTFYARPRKTQAEYIGRPRDLSLPRGSHWQPCPSIAKDPSPRSYMTRQLHPVRSPKFNSASFLAEPSNALFKQVDIGSSFLAFGLKANCQK